MKNTFLMACLLCFLATTGFSQKFGYCNSIALLSELPEKKQADSDLQAYQAQLTKKGEEMVKSLQAKAADLQKKKEAGALAPKVEQEQTAKLQIEQEDIAKYEQKVNEMLSTKREELYQPILDKVNTAMAAIAKENGFAMVFDLTSQIVLYADETLDVTKLVKTKLGI